MPDVGDRREVILAQAGKLFARKGVSATTVREIGDAAGILSGSLYHHFESKEAMVDEILAEYLEHLQHSYSQVLRATRRSEGMPRRSDRGVVSRHRSPPRRVRDLSERLQLPERPTPLLLPEEAGGRAPEGLGGGDPGRGRTGRAPLRRRSSRLLPLCPRRRLADGALVQAGRPLPHRRAGRRVHQDPDGGLCRKRPIRASRQPRAGSPPPSQAKRPRPRSRPGPRPADRRRGRGGEVSTAAGSRPRPARPRTSGRHHRSASRSARAGTGAPRHP